MADVLCVRCKKTQGEIEGVPYGGKVGEALKKTVCNLCWKAWYDQSVKIINEYRLNLRDPSAREFLATQMKIFLGTPPSPSDQGIQLSDLPKKSGE